MFVITRSHSCWLPQAGNPSDVCGHHGSVCVGCGAMQAHASETLPYCRTCRQDYTLVSQIVQEYRDFIGATDANGATALHYAAFSSSVTSIQALLDAGADRQVNLIWFDLIWFDLIWFDLIWFDLIWFDLIWFDLMELMG
jgi:ankyrin repeat protein